MFVESLRLTIELVPKTAWYINVRSEVSKSEWDRIRKKCYRKANNKCEICGDIGKNQGVLHYVECHEIWEYNDENHKQTLMGFIALCPYCHKCKHVALATITGHYEIVVEQLMKVNNMSRQQVEEYIEKSFEVWHLRNQFEWEMDISYVNRYCID